METLTHQSLWLAAAVCGLLLAGVWCHLWLFRHRFWTTRIPPENSSAVPGPATASGGGQWPAVLAVIPARDEAEVIAQSVRTILGQDYAGEIRLVVVNDNSADATAAIALAAAREANAAHSAEGPAAAACEATAAFQAEATATFPAEATAAQPSPLRHFVIVDGQPLPAGWSGKLWAIEQGICAGLAVADSAAASTNAQLAATDSTAANPTTAWVAPFSAATGAFSPEFVWLTDADIAHEPQVLRELVLRAKSERCALVSRMALLCTDSVAERWAIPAFVYFFQLLYPFRAVANPRSRICGAAGGCILLRRDCLAAIGGIASLKGALIDDCTLAANVARAGGSLHLELTRSSRSLRGYGGAKGVANMIARTAYTQLRYSPLRLAGTVFGLLFVFWGPPLLLALTAVAPDAAPLLPRAVAGLGAALACAVMTGTFVPMLRFYRLSPLRALTLPCVATFYLGATVKSALRYYQGRSGNWKGRTYQPR